jgi:tetratricopeptide (TPR) repeat protein
MKHALFFLFGVLQGAIAVAVGASAQDKTNPSAISSEVQQLIKLQDWQGAKRKLADAQAKCGSAEAGKPCRAQLNYSQGVLLQSQSAYDGSQREALLKASADAYQKALKEDPGQTAATHNLTLVFGQLGDTQGLESLYKQNEAKFPQLAAGISLTLGDLHDAGGEWEQAYTAYARATDLAPLDDSAKQRLVASFGDTAGGSEEFLSRLAAWEMQAPDLAARGYAEIFRKDGGASIAASQAIIHWVIQAAASRQISQALVMKTFGDSNAEPIRALMDFLGRLDAPFDDPMPNPGALRNFLYSGSRIVDEVPWWRETQDRRHALAEAALAVGRATTANGNVVQAQYQFLVGLQSAPSMMDYLSGPSDIDFAPLELITELAWLQYRNAEALDPTGDKLLEVIDLIIESKGMAYDARDYRAIQRHHTLLGDIFAAEGNWTGGRYGFDNAIFQLSAAITAAKRREEGEGFYQPQANVKAELADGYRAEGRSDEEKKVRVSAVLAALDMDDFKLAQSELAALSEMTPNSRPQQLAVIVKTRATVFEARIDSDKPDPSTMKLPKWATAKTVDGIDEAPLRRQQFKLLSDLAVAAALRGNAKASMKYAQAAFKVARGVSTLIGTEDVLRIERIATILIGETVNVDQPPLMKISPSARNRKRERGEWFLVLPSSDLPFTASLPPGRLADLARTPG